MRPGLAAERRPQGSSFKPRGLPFLLFPEPRGGALFVRFEVKSPRAWNGGPRGSREPGRRGSTAQTSAAGPGAPSGLGTPPRSRNTRTIRGGRTGSPGTGCGRSAQLQWAPCLPTPGPGEGASARPLRSLGRGEGTRRNPQNPSGTTEEPQTALEAEEERRAQGCGLLGPRPPRVGRARMSVPRPRCVSLGPAGEIYPTGPRGGRGKPGQEEAGGRPRDTHG